MAEPSVPSPSDRLREHPDARFGAPQHAFDLAAVAAEVAREPQAGESGHRQKALYKHGNTTISLFIFEHLTRLKPHQTRGVVSIHVLSGHLRITAGGVPHDVRAGQLLVLAPQVEHDVVAHERSEMLLTVHLEPS